MYLTDVVNLLRQELLNYTDVFSEKITISSITYNSGTGLVTVVTASAHGLNTNDLVGIQGVQGKALISSIVNVAGVATITTATDHDQTLDYIDTTLQPPVTIEGCLVAAYNGDKVIKSIPTRNKLTINIAVGTPNATSGYVKIVNSPFNGLKVVKKVDATTFTYVGVAGLPVNGIGGTVHTQTRIFGAVDPEQAVKCYTKQIATNKYLAFVCPENCIVSKNRDMENDATLVRRSGEDPRQKIITPFGIYVFIPCPDDTSGHKAYDRAIGVLKYIVQSISGALLPTVFDEQTGSGIVFEGHEFFAFFESYYVHKYSFSYCEDINAKDTIILKADVAFRDVELEIFNDLGTGTTSIETDLKLDQ